jgi:DNA-3-methyladenine glycosylase II
VERTDPVVDAIGGTSEEAHRAGLERVIQEGGRPVGWVPLAVELRRDRCSRRDGTWFKRDRAHREVAQGMTSAAAADPAAREFLRNADPVLARLIDARPDFRPRAWLDELPPLDAFGTLIFEVAGQQLSVSSTRAIISRLAGFGGHLPSPTELLAADPQVLRDSGFSARKGETLRALAERFVDGRLSTESLSRMTDVEVEATLTDVPGIGQWTARGFLLVALDRPDVFLSGDLALRRAIQQAYGFDHLPIEDEVAQVSDRRRPYRSLAVSYLFASEYDGQP